MSSLEDVRKNHEKYRAQGKPSPLGSRPSLHKQSSGDEVVIFGWNTGRNPARWGKILGFYLIYYSFLCFLTWFSIIAVAQNNQDPNQPKIQTRFHSPGIKIFPASITADKDYPDLVAQHEKNSKTNEGFGHVVLTSGAASDSEVISAYQTAWEDFLLPYKTAQENGEFVTGCNSNSPQSNSANDAMCEHYDNYDWITQQCGNDFGYGSGEPCFALSLNRILNWQPIALANNSIIEMLNVDGNSADITTDGNNVYFACDQFNMYETDVPGIFGSSTQERPDYDQTNRDSEIGKFDISWVKPASEEFSNGQNITDGGIPTYFYPFTNGHQYVDGNGKITNLNPFIVMKISVKDTSSDAISNFKCNAFAANMQFSKAKAEPSYDDETKMSYSYKWFIGSDSDDNAMPATYNSMVVQNEFSVRFKKSD